MSCSENIGEALFNVITNGNQSSIDDLFDAVNEFKKRAPRTHRNLQNNPFAAAIFDAIDSADRFMNATSNESNAMTDAESFKDGYE